MFQEFTEDTDKNREELNKMKQNMKNQVSKELEDIEGSK